MTPFFDVAEQPLFIFPEDPFDPEGIPVDSHKAICKIDSDGNPEAIGIVGKDYKLVLNRPLFEAVEQGNLNSIPYSLRENMYTVDKISHGGAFCLRQYIFPDFKVKIKQRTRETEIGYRSIVWNTYDGSGAAKLLTGAIDFFCTNGMISGEYEVFGRKHTSGFNMPDFSSMIEANIAKFYTEGEKLQRWSNTDVNLEQAATVIEEIGSSKKRQEELMVLYAQESYERGATVWALYSALTNWANHADVRRTAHDHKARTVQKREEQVLVWIQTDTWKRIADR